MGVDIRIHGRPQVVYDELAARAARAGSSLEDYVRDMLADAAAHPAADGVVARARARVERIGVRVDADSTLAARDADRR